MRRVTMAGLAVLLACATSPPPDEAAPEERRVVLDHTFNAPGPERVRVELEPGTYRAETSDGGVRFLLAPLLSGVQPPTVRDLVPGRGVTGGGLWEVIVHAAATYEVEVTGGRPGGSTTLRITRAGEPEDAR